jgi:hypothetical protein
MTLSERSSKSASRAAPKTAGRATQSSVGSTAAPKTNTSHRKTQVRIRYSRSGVQKIESPDGTVTLIFPSRLKVDLL